MLKSWRISNTNYSGEYPLKPQSVSFKVSYVKPPTVECDQKEKSTLSKSSRFASSGGEAAELAVLLLGLGDPLSVRVATDGLVRRVDEDHFEELVRRVLTDPVRVQHAQTSATATNTLLNSKSLSLMPSRSM